MPQLENVPRYWPLPDWMRQHPRTGPATTLMRPASRSALVVEMREVTVEMYVPLSMSMIIAA